MSRLRVVYLLGYGRSGSTILGNVLGELPEFFHIGELDALWQIGFALEQRVCGCGEVLAQCPVWSEIAFRIDSLHIDDLTANERARAYQSAVRLRKLPFLLWGHWSNAVSTHAKWLSSVYRAVADVTGARVIVDSSKRPANAAVVSRLSGVSTSFVHLVRDPRAVAYSWTRHRALPRPDDPTRMMIRYSPVESARSWMAANLASNMVRRSVGRARALWLRYEDFVENPGRLLKDIGTLVEFQGSSTKLHGNAIDLKVHHTVGGNPTRMTTGRTLIRADKEWVTGLPLADAAKVTAWCLPLLLAYGYPLGVTS